MTTSAPRELWQAAARAGDAWPRALRALLLSELPDLAARVDRAGAQCKAAVARLQAGDDAWDDLAVGLRALDRVLDVEGPAAMRRGRALLEGMEG